MYQDIARKDLIFQTGVGAVQFNDALILFIRFYFLSLCFMSQACCCLEKIFNIFPDDLVSSFLVV